MKLIILLFSLFIFLSPQFIIAKDCPTCPSEDDSSMKIAKVLGYGGMDSSMFLEPQLLHFYVYCVNNPINYVDPFGLSSCEEKCEESHNRCYLAATAVKANVIFYCNRLLTLITKSPYFSILPCAVIGVSIEGLLRMECDKAYRYCTSRCEQQKKEGDKECK